MYSPGQLRGRRGGLFERLGRAPNKTLAQQLRPPDPRGPIAIYTQWVRAFFRLWSHAVLAEIDAQRTDSARQDALPPNLRDLWGSLFDASGFSSTVNRAGKQVTRNVSGYIGSILKTPPSPPDQTHLINNWRAENLRLIKDVGDEQVSKLADIFKSAQERGAQHKELIAQVKDVMGSGESRAKLIARDQTTKFNGTIQRAQQTTAGITEFVWSTSHDSDVRPSHKELDGKVFTWAAPPIVDGEPATPGQPINCRCQAVPKISLFADLGAPVASPAAAPRPAPAAAPAPVVPPAPAPAPFQPFNAEAANVYHQMFSDAGISISAEHADINKFRQTQHTLFGRELQPVELKSLLGNPQSIPGAHSPKIVAAAPLGKIFLGATIRDAAGKSIAEVVRDFSKRGGEIVAKHTVMVVEKGAGVGSKLLSDQLAAYEAHGVKQIELEAAWDGQYVWSRMGFEQGAHEVMFPKTQQQFASYLVAKGEYASLTDAEAYAQQFPDLQSLALSEKGGRKLGKEYLIARGNDEMPDAVTGARDNIDMSLRVDPTDEHYQNVKRYLASRPTR